MQEAIPPFPFAGELASLGAALIWSISLSIFSLFGRDLPPAVLNLFKNVIATTCLVVVLLIGVSDVTITKWDAILLGASGIVGLALGDTALFAALSRLGAQVTSASQCLAPPLAALIALFVFQEGLNAKETSGLILTVGSIGVVILSNHSPDQQLGTLSRQVLVAGLLFAFLSAICQAIAIVTSRFALQRVGIVEGTLLRLIPAFLVLVSMLSFKRQWVDMKGLVVQRRKATVLAVAAFLGTFVGLLLMSTGAKYAKAGVAAALTSTYPIWIIPIAYVILKEKVSWKSVVSTCTAVAGIALML